MSHGVSKQTLPGAVVGRACQRTSIDGTVSTTCWCGTFRRVLDASRLQTLELEGPGKTQHSTRPRVANTERVKRVAPNVRGHTKPAIAWLIVHREALTHHLWLESLVRRCSMLYWLCSERFKCPNVMRLGCATKRVCIAGGRAPRRLRWRRDGSAYGVDGR